MESNYSSPAVALRAGTTGNVSFGLSTIGERKVIEVQTGGEKLGALLPIDGENLAEAARAAYRQRLPLICHISSSGADISEGVSAIHNWGTAAREFVNCSGVVPLIFCVTGPAVSGPALLLGLADLVIMVDESYAFVSGPNMVQQYTGENLSAEGLGGASMHANTSGVAHLVVPDVESANSLIAEILTYLPNSNDELPRPVPCDDSPSRELPNVGSIIPESPTGSYDVREVIESFIDHEYFLELRTDFASNLVTGFGHLNGKPVGLIANQPQSIAGTLDIPASQKGGRFVSFCDAFNLPIITLVDTSGFYPGKDLEWKGMIRYGAQMAFAYARATTPRVCVTLRKSYGGAYIVMDSRYMGNDVMLAWPTAEIAVMGAKGAVEILHREASEEEREELIDNYEDRLLNPYIAAERGTVDRVIDPAHTRIELIKALDMLSGKREKLPRRRHDNTPL